MYLLCKDIFTRMKITGIIFSILVLFSSCKQSAKSNATSSADSTNAPYMYFQVDTHNFGKVMQGEEIAYTFTFENKGKSDLVIKDVQTSCGCTVPKYEQKPVAPGKTGTVELVFNTAGRSGVVKKTARVISNAMPDEKALTITCEIINK